MSKKKVKVKAKHALAPLRESSFIFSSTSRTKRTSQIYRRGEQPKIAAAPIVYYTEEAWRVICMLVQKCDQEVGWLGLVDTNENDFVITDIYVPEQTVHAAETDISSDAMMNLFNELIADGQDTGKLFYWGHSHVNMGVGPSIQDEDEIDKYLVDMPVFIRGIYNKRGEAKVDVYDTNRGLIYECVDNEVIEETDGELEAAVNALIKKNVKKRVYKNSWPLVTPAHKNNGQPPLNDYGSMGRNGFYDDDIDDDFETDWAKYRGDLT